MKLSRLPGIEVSTIAATQTLLESIFQRVWEERPIDISVTEDGITPQSAIARFRRQTGMSITALAAELGLKPSKLMYAESRGKLELWRWAALSDLAMEFGMPLLSRRFDRIRFQAQNPSRGRPQIR